MSSTKTIDKGIINRQHFSDNPLTTKYNELIEEHEKDIIYNKNVYKQKIINIIFTKDLYEYLWNENRHITLINFTNNVSDKSKIKNYNKIIYSRYNSTSYYSYVSKLKFNKQDGSVYYIESNDRIFTLFDSTNNYYCISHSLILDFIEEKCEELHYSYERTDKDITIYW